ncbi:MAG: hypothetical protein M3R24_12770 [Chloroflexota bacterium]|nr:hypothetical protein [Chloroflexota bacterium]
MSDSRTTHSNPGLPNDDDMLRGIRALRESGLIAVDTPDYPLPVADVIPDELREQLSNHPSLSETIEDMRGPKG